MNLKKKTIGIIIAICLVFSLTFIAMANTGVIDGISGLFGTATDIGTASDAGEEIGTPTDADVEIGTPTDADEETGTPTDTDVETVEETDESDSDSSFGFSFLSKLFERFVNFFKNLFKIG